ncbi:TIGR00282 family metallophosphoesterase [Treponema pedis]|uniref:Metallophosphoesterase n=2 Tax=Treponema pedis TaxID=409322 RepID=S6A0S2_9SPIR|nr:TIGR00282 family metallophosphoesterase [Treponema pedis]AGT44338.1 metallophosphoesterase [Treponema pedis str. T A4]
MNILYVAEITGKAGVWVVKTMLKTLKEKFKPDFTIANANSATGSSGLGKQHAGYLKKLGIDCITISDSAFQKKDLVDSIENISYVLRPANLPSVSPGRGFKFFYNEKKEKLAVVSVLGRIGHHKIMSENPYIETEKLIEKLKTETGFIFIDFSSFATAEKQAFGFMLDGKVSAVIGSGSKVQTADEKILQNGTAYITDTGRTGSLNSVGGYAAEDRIREYKTCLPDFGKDTWERPVIQGVYLELDKTGRASKINRIFEECAAC